MIQIDRAGEPTRRVASVLDEIRIGGGFAEDVVLADETVAEHHCTLVCHTGTWFVTDDDSLHGTLVNGRRIAGTTRLAERDRIGVGPFVLALQLEAEDPVGARLLASLLSGDEAARTVYADWLEGEGRIDRAEFLRLQPKLNALRPTHADFAATTARLRGLAAEIDPGWRMKVARPPVEGCKVAKEFTCTMDWSALAPTEQPTVRSCGACKQAVHYCTTEDEALAQTRRGHCVVVDLGARRTAPSLADARSGSTVRPPGMYLPRTMPVAPPPRPQPPPQPPLRRPEASAPLWTCPACNAANVSPRCGQCGAVLT